MSLHLAPRLDAVRDATTLADFPILLEWPRLLERAAFRLRFTDAASRRGAVELTATRVSARPRRDLWGALFPAAVPVRGRARPAEEHVSSYSTGAVHSYLKSAYSWLVAREETEPDIDTSTLISGLSIVAEVVRDAAPDTARPARRGPGHIKLWAAQEQLTRPGARVLDDRPDDPGDQLALLRDFHAPVPASERRPASPSRALLVEQLDFHRRVALLGRYPALLRALGLVVDLVVPRDALPERATHGSVEVSPAWKNLAEVPGIIAVRTLCELGPASFRARRDDARRDQEGETWELHEGVVRLRGDGYELVNVDVDGLALQTVAAVESELGLRRRSRRSSTRAAVPAPRSAGLALIRAGRAERYKRRVSRSQSMERAVRRDADPLVVDADDLVRGFRADIHVASRDRWYSLCARRSDYQFLRKDGVEDIYLHVEDEGWVETAVTRDVATPERVAITGIHEALFRWHGWSLVAPHPGRPINLANQAAEISTDDEQLLGLRVTHHPQPGSLPRLRFGEDYRVRLRAVDLAGNSVQFRPEGDASDEATSSDPIRYRRFEPITSPLVVLFHERAEVSPLPLEGESTARLAIRTLNDLDAHDGDASAADAVPCQQRAVRLLAPPKVEVECAEQHGMLDGEDGRPRAELWPMLAQRDGEFDTRESASPGGASYATATLLDGSAFVLPYLPDPLAEGLTLRVGLYPRGPTQLEETLPLYGERHGWPDARGWRLELRDGPELGLRLTEGDGGDARNLSTVVVTLPRGRRAWLRVAARVSAAAARELGLIDWVRVELEQGRIEGSLEQVCRRVENGRHWMITPSRALELVHATQQPLGVPALEITPRPREPGRTSHALDVAVSVDGPSTGQVDLLAEWHEPDRESGTENRPRAAAPWSSQASYTSDDVRGSPAHEFGDTRYRRVRYRARASARYHEYLPAERFRPRPTPSRERPAIPAAPDVYRDSSASVVHVPNSARPAAPRVLEVVPIFAWTRGETSAQRTSHRGPGGLRVWLDGPWFSSGYGEMLAVVLKPKGWGLSPVPVDVVGARTLYTYWGSDPLFSSKPPPGLAPTREHFPLGVFRSARREDGETGTPDPILGRYESLPLGPYPTERLSVPGRQRVDPKADVIPHAVAWDAERGRWYCDIEFASTDSYFPFVRLALARYHPCSAPDCHLSAVTLADFAQLSPERWVSVIAVGRVRRISVSGVASPSDNSSRYTSIEATSAENKLTYAPDQNADWRAPGLVAVTPAAAAPPTSYGEPLPRKNVIDVALERQPVDAP
ncbi:MAG: hypothetical protein H6713_42985, partial [Myxococcales bacterium]|nr:hypothetical protein [Myxococcales bacterium]